MPNQPDQKKLLDMMGLNIYVTVWCGDTSGPAGTGQGLRDELPGRLHQSQKEI